MNILTFIKTDIQFQSSTLPGVKGNKLPLLLLDKGTKFVTDLCKMILHRTIIFNMLQENIKKKKKNVKNAHYYSPVPKVIVQLIIQNPKTLNILSLMT